jgi:predicted Zn-dependent protease
MPGLPPQTYTPVNAFFDSTANLAAEARGRAARFALDLVRASGDLVAAGFIQAEVGAQAVANTGKLFAYHQSTEVSYTVTMRTTDGTGSGWAGGSHSDWDGLDAEAITRRAAEKAKASRNPLALDPGAYTVVLEPQAAGDLVRLLAFALNARTSDEGRGPFTKTGGGTKLGEKIVDERVSLVSDPADPDLLTAPFDAEGLPLRRIVWIDKGVLANLFYSRFWARKQGKEPTGLPQSLRMAGGTQSIEDLVAGTDRGVLVTRLWYLRQVDPRTVLVTGLTRDGTFLIENGKISKAVKNFRFNESPLFLLSKLEGVGRAERLGGVEGGGAIVMPALRARDFHFTSLSDAV